MAALLAHFSEFHRTLAYALVFLIVLFIEGELTLPLAGVFSHRHYLDTVDLIVVAFVAAVLHDVLYFMIGARLARGGKKEFLSAKLKDNGFLEMLKRRYKAYIFISKFAWGLNKPVLAALGYLRIPFKEFLRYSVPSGLVWVIGLVLLGYSFASSTNLLQKDIKTASFLIAVFILAIVIGENILRTTIKNTMTRPRGRKDAS